MQLTHFEQHYQFLYMKRLNIYALEWLNDTILSVFFHFHNEYDQLWDQNTGITCLYVDHFCKYCPPRALVISTLKLAVRRTHHYTHVLNSQIDTMRPFKAYTAKYLMIVYTLILFEDSFIREHKPSK